MTTYVKVDTQASQQTAAIRPYATMILSPIIPSKAPTSGLVWPKGQR